MGKVAELEVEGDRRRELYRQVRKRREENKKRLGLNPQPPEPTEWSGYKLYNRITREAQKYDFVTQNKLERLGGRILTMVELNEGI